MTNESLRPLTKLPQWHALLLESLKAHGWSNEELIRRVQEGDLPKDESKFGFDYADLVAYAGEHRDEFAAAVVDGYTIKYNTLRGIHSWIFVAFGREAELALEAGREAVVVALTTEEILRLESLLSYGWKLTALDATTDAEDRIAMRIEPLNRI
jgi:hypothetical protein